MDKTPLPEKVTGPDTVGLGYWPSQITTMTVDELVKSHNQLIDYLKEREEKEQDEEFDFNEADRLHSNRKGAQKPEKKLKRWRATLDDEYWYVDDWGIIEDDVENDDRADNFRYATGNYFQTKTEAEAYRKRLLEMGASN